MLRNFSRQATIAVIAVFLNPVNGLAVAGEPGWYAGGGIGYADWDIGGVNDLNKAVTDADPDIVLSSSSVDGKDTAWKLFIGYGINENFSIEGFWRDLGEVSGTFSGVDTFFPAAVNGSIKGQADGFGVSAIAGYPVGTDGSLFARLGVFMWKMETSVSFNHNVLGSVSASDDEDGTDPIIGFGYQHDFGQIALRIEWERYMDVSDTDINVFGVSGLFRF